MGAGWCVRACVRSWDGRRLVWTKRDFRVTRPWRGQGARNGHCTDMSHGSPPRLCNPSAAAEQSANRTVQRAPHAREPSTDSRPIPDRPRRGLRNGPPPHRKRPERRRTTLKGATPSLPHSASVAPNARRPTPILALPSHSPSRIRQFISRCPPTRRRPRRTAQSSPAS